MASLYNNKISTTYVSIIKSLDNAALTASLKELSDGLGNATGLFMNTGGDFKATNILNIISSITSILNLILSFFNRCFI